MVSAMPMQCNAKLWRYGQTIKHNHWHAVLMTENAGNYVAQWRHGYYLLPDLVMVSVPLGFPSLSQQCPSTCRFNYCRFTACRCRTPSGTTCRFTAGSFACRTRERVRALGGWWTRMPCPSFHASVPGRWTRRLSDARRGQTSECPADWSMLVRQSSTPAAMSCWIRMLRGDRRQWSAAANCQCSSHHGSVLAPATAAQADVLRRLLERLWNRTSSRASRCRRRHGTCCTRRSRRRWVRVWLTFSSQTPRPAAADQSAGTVLHRLRCITTSSSTSRCSCRTRRMLTAFLFTSHLRSALCRRPSRRRSAAARRWVLADTRQLHPA